MPHKVIDAGVNVFKEQLRKDESEEKLLYRRRNGGMETRSRKNKQRRN